MPVHLCDQCHEPPGCCLCYSPPPRFAILAPQQGVTPAAADIEAALVKLGWVRFDGNGDPDVALFHNTSPKGDYFEAGFWAGRGVPVFFIGGGGRRCAERKQLAKAMGAWLVIGQDNRATLAEILHTLHERFKP